MTTVIRSLLLACGQIADPLVLRILAKSMAITLVIFFAMGMATFQLILNSSAYIGASIGTEVAYLVTVTLTLLLGWLLFRIVAMAVIQFFADEVVLAVEGQHYPDAVQAARKLPFREDLANVARSAGRALLYNMLALPVALVLLFTAIGPAVVFLLVNAVLLGRELTDMPWLRHRSASDVVNPVGAGQRFLLGAGIAALMFMPFVNFLGPIIGAAAGTHLFHLNRKQASNA